MKELTVYLALDLDFVRTSMKYMLRNFDFIHEIKRLTQLEELNKLVQPNIFPVLLVDSRVVNENKETIVNLVNHLMEDLTIVVFITGNEDLKFYQQIYVDDFLYLNSDAAEIEKVFKRIAINNIAGSKMKKEIDWKKLSEKTKLSIQALKVLRGICKGLTSKQIADELCRSKRTVDGHRRNLLQATGAKTPGELVTYSIKNNLFPNVFVTD